MTTPAATESVALTVRQVDELSKQLATMRHDINNHLSLMMAAMELVRRKPEAAERMASTLADQPVKITEAMKIFTRNFDATLGGHRS